MAIKDGITSWFIQNIVIPNAEDIRNPGYIISKFSDKNKQVSIREFFFPEKFYQIFETSIASELGKKGEKRLYSIGKRFGYRYAKISRYGNTSTMKKNDIEGFMYLFMRYIEVIYANKIEHKIDVEKKYLEIEADAYAGCEGNGLGYILLIGAGTGVWSYLMNDSKVDGYQITCQGRGDKLCKLVCAPINELKKLAKNAISEENVEGLDENYQKYEVLNKVYPTINKNLSLKELIENKIFKYEKGKLFFQKQRMVGIEFSIYYMIDNEFSKDEKTNKIIFDSAFEAGRDIGVGRDIIFIQKFLSSLGFGDTQIISQNGKYIARFYHFPWASISKNCKHTIISGFTSGLISGAMKKNIVLKTVTTHEGGDGYHIKLD